MPIPRPEEIKKSINRVTATGIKKMCYGIAGVLTLPVPIKSTHKENGYAIPQYFDTDRPLAGESHVKIHIKPTLDPIPSDKHSTHTQPRHPMGSGPREKKAFTRLQRQDIKKPFFEIERIYNFLFK